MRRESGYTLQHTSYCSIKAPFAFHVFDLHHLKGAFAIPLLKVGWHLLDMVVSVTSCDVPSMTRLTQKALLFSGSRTVPRTPRSAVVSIVLDYPFPL